MTGVLVSWQHATEDMLCFIYINQIYVRTCLQIQFFTYSLQIELINPDFLPWMFQQDYWLPIWISVQYPIGSSYGFEKSPVRKLEHRPYFSLIFPFMDTPFSLPFTTSPPMHSLIDKLIQTYSFSPPLHTWWLIRSLTLPAMAGWTAQDSWLPR